MLAFFTSVFSSCAQEKAYHKVINTLYKGTVPTITAEEVNAKQTNEHIIILDSREPAEFQVSHIEGAIPVGFDDFQMANLPSISKTDTVIVYCSVGYRSERIGEKLLAAGYLNVFNMYGGIFEWVNHNLPVVDTNNTPTDTTHAYSRLWGKWLTKGEKVYGK